MLADQRQHPEARLVAVAGRASYRLRLDDGLLEGSAEFTLPAPRVDRRAVLAVS
ncbi:MAG: hypothetical protein ABIR39_24235 [Nocardioides sp.]|uniref:hypothetical protein n=1 Tax=Nocardioides sp. TaxID=35761 RepID=UPI003262F6DC